LIGTNLANNSLPWLSCYIVALT